MPYKDNDILLVNPTGGWEQKTEDAYFFPTGLLYLQNYLLKHGIPSTIIDVKPMGLSPDKFKQLLLKYRPKIIGKAIKKDLDPATVIPFAGECKKLGIRALVFIMYTLPEETMDDFFMTMNILKKIKPYIYDISFNQTLILPGTEIERDARRLKLLDDNFSWYDRNYNTIPVWKTLMNDEEINECARLLQHYQYLLHHSKVHYLRKKLKHHCMERLTGNKQLVEFVRRRPNFHKFMESKMHWIFGSDE